MSSETYSEDREVDHVVTAVPSLDDQRSRYDQDTPSLDYEQSRTTFSFDRVQANTTMPQTPIARTLGKPKFPSWDLGFLRQIARWFREQKRNNDKNRGK